MKALWSHRMTKPLNTFMRRGVLFVLAGAMALTMTLTPVATRPASAVGFSDLLSLGGSFTNGLSSCAIESVGWIICPTMRSIAKLADYGFAYINKDFLKIDYNIASNDGGTYKAWQTMLTIANALFVVAFMTLIYSQLTGRASGGYSIKRLLPRLIIAAVAVNISYYICVFCIDVVNILGDGILDALTKIAGGVGTAIMPIGNTSTNDGTLSTITSSVMQKSGGTAWVLLAPVAAVTISIATITAAGLVLLIMRKTVVAMLILVSPILFVAYLLPNLEKFFFQGVRLFTQLLLLYPIIALLLGAGQIVSATIVTVGTGDTNYRVSGDSYFAKNGSGSAITDLTASAAAVLPLLAVWFIFKNMSSVMSTAGSRLSASIRGRRGEGDKEARVTGKATLGAANNKTPLGLDGTPNRRQGFSRNRRRSSLGGSSLTGDEEPGAARAPSQPSANRNAAQSALDSNTGTSDEDIAKRFEDLQNAQINGKADDMDVQSAVAGAVAGSDLKATTDDKDKKRTAKDIFNSLNRGHESKDKDTKIGNGQSPAGGGQAGGGSAQPSAPSVGFKAPVMAQSGNIISGTSSQQPTQTRIVAVPVQIDGSALLGQNNQHRPPENITQAPISGTEEKAKARAQKYLYDADAQIADAADKVDILGKSHGDAPREQPHVDSPIHHDDKSDKDRKDDE